MQQGNEMMSPLEANLVNAFQTMSQVRMQCSLFHDSAMRCIDKCMDTSELVTNKRASLKPAERLKLDKEEKDCLSGCGAKWDDMFRRQTLALNRRETGRIQLEFMKESMAAAGQGAPAR